MRQLIKSNIPIPDPHARWNVRNVLINLVGILAVAMLGAFLAGVFEMPPITAAVLAMSGVYVICDVLDEFFPLKTWEVTNGRPEL